MENFSYLLEAGGMEKVSISEPVSMINWLEELDI